MMHAVWQQNVVTTAPTQATNRDRDRDRYRRYHHPDPEGIVSVSSATRLGRPYLPLQSNLDRKPVRATLLRDTLEHDARLARHHSSCPSAVPLRGSVPCTRIMSITFLQSCDLHRSRNAVIITVAMSISAQCEEGGERPGTQ
jgi:hypothetical protein